MAPFCSLFRFPGLGQRERFLSSRPPEAVLHRGGVSDRGDSGELHGRKVPRSRVNCLQQAVEVIRKTNSNRDELLFKFE